MNPDSEGFFHGGPRLRQNIFTAAGKLKKLNCNKSKPNRKNLKRDQPPNKRRFIYGKLSMAVVAFWQKQFSPLINKCTNVFHGYQFMFNSAWHRRKLIFITLPISLQQHTYQNVFQKIEAKWLANSSKFKANGQHFVYILFFWTFRDSNYLIVEWFKISETLNWNIILFTATKPTPP